jgi:DNA polymerase-1
MTLAQRLGFPDSPVFLIDGSAFFHRGYHASRDISRSDGFPTNALFMVLRLLLKLLRDESPRHAVFFMDGPGPTFRSKIYSEYKANREAMPEPLAVQIEPLLTGVRLLGFPVIVPEAAEADDGIASLAARFRQFRPVVIVGADKDLKQCLEGPVVLYDPSGKAEKLTTGDDLMAECGIAPASWPDLQALTGDASDNIPGVPGVGIKTALALLREHPTLEDLRDHLDAVKPTVRAKIEPHMEDVFRYRDLTRLRTDLLPGLGLADVALTRPDPARLRAFFETYEFRSLIRELEGLPAPAPRQAKRPSLLDLDPAPTPARGPALTPLADIPDFSGRDIGLVPAEAGYHLSLPPREWTTDASPAALSPRLAAAARVAAPSVKALLAADPAFEAVPLSRWFDLGLAAYLLSPEQRVYDWPRLRDSLVADPAVDSRDLRPDDQARAAALLADILAGRLAGAGLIELARDLEMPLVPVLVRMERAGIGLDLAGVAAFAAEVGRELARLEAAIQEAAGKPFNPRSSRQLADILYGELGLAAQGKTPGGAASTSQEALERLAGAHPLVDRILEYRKLEKLRSTYLDPLPRLADASGRIHTTFNNLATATGRLSSSNPNLQNIPIRGELGRRMRECFVAGPGQVLVAADYSQIELRVLAHLSGEPALLSAFAHGADIHARTAALLFDKPEDAITPDERRQAKTINFGLLYGMGPQKLSRDLGIKLDAAKAFIAKYFERLPGLSAFYDAIVEGARNQGYVVTLAGRRRLVPDIDSQNSQLASQARRQAINTVVQGSAADIIKMAMLAADADETLRRLGGRLVLQIHDELLLEVPEAAGREAGTRLAAVMSGIMPLAVPLTVDWGQGRTWGQAH